MKAEGPSPMVVVEWTQRSSDICVGCMFLRESSEPNLIELLGRERSE